MRAEVFQWGPVNAFIEFYLPIISAPFNSQCCSRKDGGVNLVKDVPLGLKKLTCW